MGFFHVLIIIGLLAAIAIPIIRVAIAYDQAGVRREDRSGIGFPWKQITIPAIILPIYLFGLMPAFGQVDTGYKGVVVSFGQATGEVKDEGLYVLPPVVYSVEPMNTRNQIYGGKGIEAASKDLQVVSVDAVVNYRPNPVSIVDIYRNYRRDYEAMVLVPTTNEAIKSVTARYTAEQLIQQRPLVKEQIDTLLGERLADAGLMLESVSITNFDFAKDFQDTIEKQAVSERKVSVERNELAQAEIREQQKVVVAKNAADAAIQTARGQAESTRMRGEADAAAIRLRAEALQQNQKLVELEAVMKWNGQLPAYQFGGGNGSIPVFQIPLPAVTAPAR